MIYRFSIPGRLPGLNEIISRINRHRHAGNRQKQKVTQQCAWEIIRMNVPKFLRPVIVRLRFIEPNRRRDRDNIQSGSKFILDALQITGRLINDSQKWVRHVRPEVADFVDKINPRIDIEIEECE